MTSLFRSFRDGSRYRPLHRLFLATALTAFTVFTLRPVCDALAAPLVRAPVSNTAQHAAHHGVHHAAQHGSPHEAADLPGCCVQLESGAIVHPLNPVASAAPDQGWALPGAPRALLASGVTPYRPAFTPGAPPPLASFYARSARIRR